MCDEQEEMLDDIAIVLEAVNHRGSTEDELRGAVADALAIIAGNGDEEEEEDEDEDEDETEFEDEDEDEEEEEQIEA